MSLYVIGDSHKQSFIRIATPLPNCKSTTIYTACTSNILDFKAQNVEEDSIVIVSLGEIDIRYRINQIIKSYPQDDKSAEDTVITNLTDMYLNELLKRISLYNHISIILYIGPLSDVPGSFDSIEAPRRGTREERIRYRNKIINKLTDMTRQFNDVSKKNRILVFDVFDIFSNYEGVLSGQFWDKYTVHVNDIFTPVIENQLQKFIYKNIDAKIAVCFPNNTKEFVRNRT